ncbi:DNA-3-methyladenine glycosylase 2 family protein [Dermatobacter hominis]|uniref:DNA-3-methyladenine glycosylase 2 family protein n=1 Tax=Dermatobacter hominis TaxID=2884263 RepID=UPI001D0FFEFA|nr:AlkA N-terminal domain-containing protein [Dermatobacter hominis]UDY34323.1 helix-turn-helix domain-containing protein [Dermatobacter hominis]
MPATTVPPDELLLDQDRCYLAVQSKDARFDGWFVGAVTSTGIYCRPSCPVRPPRRTNMRFYPTAAAAQQAGFRACKRCRPDASPGSPEWDPRADVVARAVRLIADGTVDREGVPGLARRLGYSHRQVERLLRAQLGTGPLALARAQRARTARTLIETSDLGFAEVCFAAGFSSVRQFNATVREVYDLTPGELRRRARARQAATPGTLHLRLPFRPPLSADRLFGHLLDAAVPGVEAAGWCGADAGATAPTYRRSLRLAHGAGVVALTPFADHVAAELRLEDLRDLTSAVARCRRLLDLDADPVAVDEVLAADSLLRRSVRRAPGRRVPRTVDGDELAVRVVLAQQVATSAVRTHAARLAAAIGDTLPEALRHGVDGDAGDGDADGAGSDVSLLFPTAAQLATAFDDLPLRLPTRRRDTLRALVETLADGAVDLGPGADRDAARAGLAALPGVGPWTVELIAMRGLGDPDAFPVTDLVVRRGAERLGIPATPAALADRAGRWRPWRSVAVQHLWAAGHPDHRADGATTTAGSGPATDDRRRR